MMADTGHEIQGKRVLVTGGTGFIGSRLVKELLDRGAEVTVLVDGESKLWRVEPLLANPRLRLLLCYLADSNSVAAQRKIWGDIDLLAHLRLHMPLTNSVAAQRKIWGDADVRAHLGLHMPLTTALCDQAMEDINANLLPTLNLIRALGDSLQGICFASSVAVYGRPAHLPVKEDELPNPISSYGATKLAIENYLRAYGQVSQTPVTILRYATVYGPGELGHRAIPNFLHSLTRRQSPLVYGDGSEIRDYVYIGDVVEATIRALVRRPAQVLNIGSGQGYSSLQIARELMRLCSIDIEPRFHPVATEKADLICDISAAQEALGYFPEITLENGLRQEIEWYRGEMPTSLREERSLKI